MRTAGAVELMVGTAGTRNHRILFVDDDPTMHNEVLRALADEPVRVLSAESAERALEIIESEPVHVLISDQHMDGMQGSTLMAIIARRHEEITRILLTARPSVDTTMAAINAGSVYRFLAKPFDRADLVATVRGATTLYDKAIMHRELYRLAQVQASLMNMPAAGVAPPPARRPVTQAVPAPDAADDVPLVLGPDEDPLERIDEETRRELSRRELEVLIGLLRGYWVKDLAAEYCISPHTVRNHIKSIYRKLGVHSQSELLARCLGHPAA